MSMKKTILTIHPMIRNVLLLLPLLAVLLLYFLQEGIKIDRLKIGNFIVQGLYLKLDNKLTLKMDILSIPKAKTTDDLSDLDSNLRKVKKMLTFFDSIELNSVRFTNDEYRVVYAGDTIYIDNKDYEIAGMITPQNGGMVAKIPLIHIKKYHLRLQGQMTYGYKSKKTTFQGGYALRHIHGKLSVEMQEEKLSFLVDSQETRDIGKILDMFAIPQNIRVWIDKKVRAKKYKLLSLKGQGHIRKDGFDLDIKNLRAEARLREVTIKFHDRLKPIKSPSALVRFHDNRLDFDLKDPHYRKKPMAGSQVALLHLTGKKHLQLLLKLKFYTPYDKQIKEILDAYHVSIPLMQKKGKVRATLALDVDLKTKKVKVEGRALVSKGVMVIGGTSLQTSGGEVTFTSDRVALWDLGLYDDWYKGVVNGTIHLNTKKATFNVNLKQLKLGDKKGVQLYLKNRKKLSVTMDYSKRLRFEIPHYKLRIEEQKKGGLRIISSDIKPLLPAIKGLPFAVKKGKITLNTHNYKRYDFEGELVWEGSYFYSDKGFLTAIPFKGNYDADTVRINALNKRVTYDSKRARVGLKNINIDAKKMLNTKGTKTGPKIKKLNVHGTEGRIRYDEYILLTDNFDLSIRGKNSTFTAIKDGDKVRVERNGESLVVHANQIKDKMLKSLLHFKGLKGGRYSLEMFGRIDGEMRGVIDIKGGAIESIKAYNDLIALFNTIPALMTLSDPGFSKKGFVIRDGKIEFRILPDRVMFDTIYLNGKSATIAGKGSVALGSGKLNIDLAVRTAREVGKVLGSLPLVGYILFGKDKSITTGVKITGTLDNPKTKTHPVQEALLYPLELLKRTITSPAHIINK